MALGAEFGPRFNGTDNYDWLRAQRRADQQIISGTQISVTPQSSKGAICGRLIDTSVNVNGLGGIPITPNTVGPGALQTAIYAAPTYQANPSITAYASLQGLLQDLDAKPIFTNVPQDGSVARIAWAIRRAKDPILPDHSKSAATVVRVTGFISSGSPNTGGVAFTAANAPAVGNLVLCCVSGYGTQTVAAGWASASDNSSVPNMLFAWKIWQAADTTNLTQVASSGAFVSNNTVTIAYEITGVNQTTPISISGFTGVSGSPINGPSLVPNELHTLPVVMFTSQTYDSAPTPPALTGGFGYDTTVSTNLSAATNYQATGHATTLTADITSAIQCGFTAPTEMATAGFRGGMVLVRSLNPGGTIGGTVYPWIVQAETEIAGLPYPAVSQQGEYSYGQVASGITYDLGAAYVSARGDLGTISAFAANYVSSNNLAIPNHYFIGNTSYTPVGSPGIPANSGYPVVTTAVPAFQLSPSVNGMATAISIAFQIMNQPLDGSLSRVSLWYRQVGDTLYSFYGSIKAAGVGLPLPVSGAAVTLPIVGNYKFTYADLSNGTPFEFGFSCEDTRGDETDISPLSIAPPVTVPSPPGLANGSTNLVVDADFQAAKYGTGTGGFSHTQVAGSDPYWFFNGIDGNVSVLSQENGGIMQQDIAASGRAFFAISTPITLYPGKTYTVSCYCDNGNNQVSGGATGGSYVAIVDATGANTFNTVYAKAQGAAGKSQTVSAQYSITGAVPMVVAVMLHNDSMTINTGGYFRIGKPMLQEGNLSAYVKGPLTPGSGLVTQSVAIATAGANADTAKNAPTITSGAIPVSGASAPVADQAPPASIRMTASGVYTQTGATATSPTWVASGGGPATLASLTDIDATTKGAGKFLTYNATTAKFDFETPAGGSGGGGTSASGGTPVTFSTTAASNTLFPSTTTVQGAAGKKLVIRVLAGVHQNGVVAVGVPGGFGILLISQSDGNVVMYTMAGNNITAAYVLSSGASSRIFDGNATGVFELTLFFTGSAGVFVSAKINDYPIVAAYGTNSGYNLGTLFAQDLTASPLTIYTNVAANVAQYSLTGSTDFASGGAATSGGAQPYMYNFQTNSSGGSGGLTVNFAQSTLNNTLVFIAYYQNNFTFTPPSGYVQYGTTQTFGFESVAVFVKTSDGTETSATITYSGNAPNGAAVFELSPCAPYASNFTATNSTPLTGIKPGSLLLAFMGGCYGVGSGNGIAFGNTLNWTGVSVIQPYLSGRFEYFLNSTPSSITYRGSAGGTATGVGSLVLALS